MEPAFARGLATAPRVPGPQDQRRRAGTLTKTASGAYDYADFGTWWAKSLIAFATAAGGIVPDYISIQNEPDFTTTNEGTCLFDPIEDATNAGYGPRSPP